MSKTFAAIYENGVLRPLEDPGLKESVRVEVTVRESRDSPLITLGDAREFFLPHEWEEASRDEITLPAVWQAMAAIRGSLADAVIEAREERF